MEQKITIVSPYENLKQVSLQVIKEKNLYIDVELGNLKEGLKKVKDSMEKGKEIFISRGGTADIIRKNMNVPVIEIKVTGYDLLRALYKYKDYNKPIAVIDYNTIIDGAKTIGEILGVDIKYFGVSNKEEIISCVKEAIQKGIDLIIGGTFTVEVAKQEGIKCELIESGKESIINAIEEAFELYELTMKEREEKKKFKTILDFSNEGIISVDNKGIIQVFNPAAEKIFCISKEYALGKCIKDIVPDTRIPHVLQTKEMDIGSIQNINKLVVATNRIPIIINENIRGVIATFQDVTRVQELEQKIRQQLSKKGLVAKHTFDSIIGNSNIIIKTKNIAREYAKTDSTVLLLGESGTGKELFAQAIHNYSGRKEGPFVAVNCAALPGNLLESELFGYSEGAFTGAKKGGKAGLFELAHNGTIFLDEISEMDINLQARMLRVLQEREVMRIGDDKVIPINVRVIAASNRDLKKESKEGKFRMDLYYRLNVLNLDIPPLRNRDGDIEELVNFFIREFNKNYNYSVKYVDSFSLDILNNYSYPGNIRELQNIIEKMVVLTKEGSINKEIIEAMVYQFEEENKEFIDEHNLLEGTLVEIEKKVIRKILEEEEYNKTKTAIRLGIDRGTITRKLKSDA